MRRSPVLVAPPRVAELPPDCWARVPAANRVRLLWLLSRLAERRWQAGRLRGEEDDRERRDTHE